MTWLSVRQRLVIGMIMGATLFGLLLLANHFQMFVKCNTNYVCIPTSQLKGAK